jgi:hypothetical protein
MHGEERSHENNSAVDRKKLERFEVKRIDDVFGRMLV